MAFLSSLTAAHETAYPSDFKERLRHFPLLEKISDGALSRLLDTANWFGLPGGITLPRDGDNDRALFFVLTGCLGVFVEDADGTRRLAAHIPAGQTVGEMSLISGEPHSAALVALRDSELLRISASSFDALIARHPRVMFNLMQVLIERLRQTSRHVGDTKRPKSFALVPLQTGLEQEHIATRLAAALSEMGSKVAVLDASAAHQSAEWLNAFEASHDIIFYRGDTPGGAWTQLCLRQADRVFLLARADRPLPLRPLDLPAAKTYIGGLPELLLLHPAERYSGLPEHFTVKSRLFETHHHVRLGELNDIRRLARFISGRAVGLVLAGGGARGFAHIGILRALADQHVPFDRLGGASMGAIIAAGLAMEWSLDELTERMRAAFVTHNPLDDFTLPLIALVRGRKVSHLLRKHFGDVRIEELAKPFFCVSSNLTTGRIHVHRSGLLWRALRASVSLPGILPPVTQRGHLLVDGGVMNNLPVDVMAQARHGPIIASDVTGEIDLHATDERYGERPWWWLLSQRMRGSPSLVSILMRSGTVGSEAQRRIVREQADFLFEPLLLDVGLRDWQAFDRAIAEGYAHATARIEHRGLAMIDRWAEGLPPAPR